ncbi:MAG: TonB-dependent receptor [Acidobacteriia bacterium]|nr:TonB-dependent receptor [Terriglobia bacterium]
MKTLCLILGIASLAPAQTSTGAIFGRITDETGGAISAAKVTVEQENTGFLRSALTNLSGEYRIEELSPGTFSVTAQRPGFETAVAAHVTVEVRQQAHLDLRLKVGQMRESVDVVARLSGVDAEDSAIGYRFDSAMATQLPLDERNVIALVTLGPGAVPRQLGGFTHDVDNDVQQGSRGSVALNPPINGARPSMNSFLMDGADNTDRNAFAIVVTPPVEAVQEFRIQSSLAPSGVVQSGGGLVDLVTRSGGRNFHGSAFEYFRNEATDGRNYFDDPTLPRPIFRRNQYGASLGGPLPLPSTYFFAAYEGLRQKSATPSLQLVPDAALRSGDFTNGAPIFDPLGAATAADRAPFPGNSIPANRIDPIARNYLANYEPLPNRPNNPSSNYMDATPNTSHNDSGSMRLDHQFRRGGLLFGRYTINDDRGGLGGAFPLRPTSEMLRAQQVAVGYTTDGSGWVNELRGAFNRLRLFDAPLANQNIAAALGIPGAPTDPFTFGLPYFFLTDFSTVTDDPTLPQIQRDNTWSVSDGFSLVRGARTYKVGVSATRFQLNYRQSNNIRGQYTYTGAYTGNGDPTTGDALADFLLGDAQRTERSVGDSQAYLRQSNYSAFAEQDWRASSRLTLTLSLRYEYFAPFTERRNRLLNLDYSTLPQAPRLVTVPRAFEANRTDFAPRAGLAWRLPRFLSGRGRRRVSQLFRPGSPIAHALCSAMECRVSARASRQHRSRSGLCRQQRHAPWPVPPVQHRAAHRDRREPRPAARRLAVAAHLSFARADFPAPAHRQLLLQLSAAQSGKAFPGLALFPGELRLGEIH